MFRKTNGPLVKLRCTTLRRGNTQGDPLAMPMYALAIIRLIRSLNWKAHQTWYADDASGVGKMQELRKWWDDISNVGTEYGYHANAKKTWLITQPESQEDLANHPA